ncbi:MAG: hypothetical protein E7557_06155 [Ruminococcaceae bacterium]|nr:hypothetical protein [Oscillospiraceae bacterium]
MALELTRKGGNNKEPKPQINILPKIEEFFQKNPIMKIVIPVIGFLIIVAIFLLIVFGDKVLTEKPDASTGVQNPNSNVIEVLPGGNDITDEKVLEIINKNPLSADILSTAKYTGYASGSSGLKTALIEIGSQKDILVLSIGETVGESSWEIIEINEDYVLLKAGNATKKLTK